MTGWRDRMAVAEEETATVCQLLDWYLEDSDRDFARLAILAHHADWTSGAMTHRGEGDDQ